jgi:hypothetical protein
VEINGSVGNNLTAQLLFDKRQNCISVLSKMSYNEDSGNVEQKGKGGDSGREITDRLFDYLHDRGITQFDAACNTGTVREAEYF